MHLGITENANPGHRSEASLFERTEDPKNNNNKKDIMSRA
jgi:hypothetical protein